MRIRVENMGPLQTALIERPDDGVTVISGPSASGKTTRMLALFFALYGVTPDGSNRREHIIPMIRDGSGWMASAVTLPGFAIKRAIDRTGRVRRWVSTPDGVVELPSSLAERDVLARFPAVWQNRAKVAMVALPFEWERALTTGNNGLELRTRLVEMLPGPTAEDIIAAEIPETRPRTEAASTSARRTFKTKMDEAAGAKAKAAEQYASAVKSAPAAGPTPEQVAKAEADIAAYDAAVAAAAAAREAFGVWTTQNSAVERWERRFDGLKPPACEQESENIESLRREERDIKAEADTLRAGKIAARDRITVLEREIKDGLAKAPPEVPCGGQILLVPEHPGDEESEVVERDCGTCPLLKQFGKPFDPAPQRAEIATLQDQVAESDRQIAKLEADARAVGQRIENAKAWADFDAETKALGPKPPEPGERPQVPLVPNVSAAHKILADAHADTRIRADHDARVAKLKAAAERADADHKRAEAAFARAEADLAIIRGAPSKALAAKMALLGDGPLRFRVDGDAFIAEINGRALHAVTSRGERLVADADFRRRLRDACKMGDVPIFVDNRQDAAGDIVGALPEIPNSIVLVTTTDPAGGPNV